MPPLSFYAGFRFDDFRYFFYLLIIAAVALILLMLFISSLPLFAISSFRRFDAAADATRC